MNIEHIDLLKEKFLNGTISSEELQVLHEYYDSQPPGEMENLRQERFVLLSLKRELEIQKFESLISQFDESLYSPQGKILLYEAASATPTSEEEKEETSEQINKEDLDMDPD